MEDLARGDVVVFEEHLGRVIRIAKDNRAADSGRSAWVQFRGRDTEYFSLRRDGAWRRFPGAADAPGLRMASVEEILAADLTKKMITV